MNPPSLVQHVFEGEDLIKVAWESFLEHIDNYSTKKTSKLKSQRSHMPSNALHPSSFHERQLDEKLQIACGCPRDLDETILATLLHPAFRQFIDDSQTHLTTEDDNNLVHKLTNVMLAFYENERKWVEVVSDVLATYQLGFHLNSKVQGMAYVMDADMSVNIHNHCHPFVIAEFKNKATTSTSEPYIQALLYYLESTRIFTPSMSGSALWCFLLILFGQCL